MEGTLAEIRLFGGDFQPRGWAFCRGQLLGISQYSALFSLIGTWYGGDGRVSFALPNFQGTKPIHRPNHAVSKYMPTYLGQKGGTEKYKLDVQEIPAHHHNITGGTVTGTANVPCDNNNGNTEEPDNAYFATSPIREVYSNIADTELAPISVPHGSYGFTLEPGEGTNTPIDVRDPYLTLNYIICVVGDYPIFN